MSDGVLSVFPTGLYYRNENTQLVKKHAPHYAKAQEIIKNRMKSAPQIEEQAYDYSITATKMRNKYLNELFDYVADVHKAEVKSGKSHHSVSNYDVLELYQKINGYNEKEFTRMLRAKTPEGSRAYSFKEINKMLDESIVEHFRVIREQQAAAKAAKQGKSVVAANPVEVSPVATNQVLNSVNTETVGGIIPKERALTITRNVETPVKPFSEVLMEQIRESAHAVMNPKETIRFTELPNIAPAAGAPNTAESVVSEVITGAEEVLRDAGKEVPNATEEVLRDVEKEASNMAEEALRDAGKEAPKAGENIASVVGETVKEGLEDTGKKARRIGKKGWAGIAIVVVALITGLVIRNKNKKKAQNLNVNA